jgi:hypothetical protein
MYHCTFCEKDGHQESFCYRHAKRMRQTRSSRHLVVHSPSHGMNTCEPRKKPLFTDGFYHSFSSDLGHDHGHASSASCVGPWHVSHGACIGSSYKTLGDACLFANGTTRSVSWVVLLRNASKGVSKLHLNQHLHHANPHDKMSAPFRHV